MAGASNNGGWPPDGGASDDLPDLPEEWGVIVIPDDLSELSDEVEAVRTELNTAVPATGWRRFTRSGPVRRLRRLCALAVRTPVLIISMAVLVTVASLFASAWPGPPRQPATQRTAATTTEPAGKLPAMDLISDDGQTASLLSRLPAVIVLTDGCTCDQLLADTAGLVDPNTAVIAVSATAASARMLPPAQTPQVPGKATIRLQDPTGGLRQHFQIGTPDGTAAVLIVDNTGKVLRVHQRVATVERIRADLARV
ncbi:hypothetical protein [Actinoplanes sp. DH11]|uniref:hypothetical protein n=1 Tax=Actinoplanes sp. DH11 TaxID=2857011 RepID=UPI001E2960A4|nr:hypothetical protein [Actinoplanes sp. DH11]